MVLRWSLAGFNVVYDRMRKGRWSWGEGVGAFGKEKTARKLPNFSSVRESETKDSTKARRGRVPSLIQRIRGGVNAPEKLQPIEPARVSFHYKVR